MNTFYEHHKHSIKFAYRCFDRILLNGLIQPFQQPRASGLLATSYAISLSKFRTGSRTVARNGARQSWMRRREGVMTLLIPTLSTPRKIR